MRIARQFLVPAILALVLGGAWLLQRRVNGELSGTIESFRAQNREVEQLRVERARLVKAQVSPAEMASLRADHAAVARLRDEVEAAKARVVALERAESASAPGH